MNIKRRMDGELVKCKEFRLTAKTVCRRVNSSMRYYKPECIWKTKCFVCTMISL